MIFDALFGDTEEEPMISVSLSIPRKRRWRTVYFELHNAGRCLVCSLTYGLPQVFDATHHLKVWSVTLRARRMGTR